MRHGVKIQQIYPGIRSGADVRACIQAKTTVRNSAPFAADSGRGAIATGTPSPLMKFFHTLSRAPFGLSQKASISATFASGAGSMLGPTRKGVWCPISNYYEL